MPKEASTPPMDALLASDAAADPGSSATMTGAAMMPQVQPNRLSFCTNAHRKVFQVHRETPQSSFRTSPAV